MVIAVGSASAERSFSTLRIIKTRVYIHDYYASSSFSAAINRKRVQFGVVERSYAKIIDEFAKMKNNANSIY